jgi:hypothetical protein
MAFALAGGFIAQTFEALEEGTIRSVGHLQIADRRAVGKAEEATLEFGIPDARRARSVAAKDPDVQAVPRIDFVGSPPMGLSRCRSSASAWIRDRRRRRWRPS